MTFSCYGQSQWNAIKNPLLRFCYLNLHTPTSLVQYEATEALLVVD